MNETITPDDILDQAILLAQTSSWETFSFSELAKQLACPLSQISHHYRSKDDLAEALFNRADDAMLDLSLDQNFQGLKSNKKLIKCITTWFEYLAPYKSLVREIMAYKLEPGHFHLQAHGITRVSRTVQWFLSVSDRPFSGIKRTADEVAVTSAYLSSFAYFLSDDSENHRKTKRLLQTLVKRIECGHSLFDKVSETKFMQHSKKHTKS